MKDLKSAIESILFVQGEPLEVPGIAKATGAGKAEVERALAELAEEYRTRGIILIQNAGEWQFATNPDHKELVERFLASDFSDELTRAPLEVLSIITYKGPISRANIEYIRGVNSSFTLRNLLIRGLVSRAENPADRRSYLYRISTDFLKYLGIGSTRDLPRYEEFRKAAVEAPVEATPPAVPEDMPPQTP